MISQKTYSIGLVELPVLGLIDEDGKDWLGGVSNASALISKQILLSSLRAEGFDAQLVNLKNGDYTGEYGKAIWRNIEFTKVYIGKKLKDIDPLAYDAWGVTNNFAQEREIACMTIRHLSEKGIPVVAGGSDVIADFQPYLDAGASAVVLDKSGSANAPVMDYVLGRTPRRELSGVVLKNSSQQPPIRVRPPLNPEDWALPEISVAKQCLGTQYKAFPLPEKLKPIGSVFTDIGCDRKCDFCQTPNYHLGYRAMSPEKIFNWLEIQKQAGAGSFFCSSDQFLGRILRKNGREEILEIMKGIRELGIAVFWNNGLELKKATKGRGLKSSNDLTPDEELISALWGWDGKAGCYFAYIPAERPVVGQQNYKKLLPWQDHCNILKAIAQTGIPYLRYGVIIGFPDDNEESMLRLEEAISELYMELSSANPSLKFQVAAFGISPIPGTPQWLGMRESGLLRFDDPSLFGCFWTPSVDTRYMSYEDVADWQKRLVQIGDAYMGI